MKLLTYFLAATIAVGTTAQAWALNLCEKTSGGYSAMFFNGVWNTEVDALLSMEALRSVVGDTYNNEPVQFDLLYNETGEVAGASMFQDVAEVFIQRGHESGFDPEKNFDLFWDAYHGNADGFFAKIGNLLGAASSAVASMFEDLLTSISTKKVALYSLMLSSPRTSDVYIRHNLLVKSIALQGKKMLMVAHSQGNLFMNKAYDTALTLPNISSGNVAALHVAPASIQTKGPHVLADMDLVINGLRVFGIHSVPSVTFDLPLSHMAVDVSGHTFVDTYLNPSQKGLAQIVGHQKSLMDALVAPRAITSDGAFTATLTWNTTGDVDLHVYEPNLSHVYYSSKRGTSGRLDLDNMDGYGPEHYYASCESTELQEGLYVIAVNNYRAPTGAVASIQISTPEASDLVTKQLTLGASKGWSGDNSPVQLISVQVTKEASGKATIYAQ